MDFSFFLFHFYGCESYTTLKYLKGCYKIFYSDLQVYAGKHDSSITEENEQIRNVEKIAQDLSYR